MVNTDILLKVLHNYEIIYIRNCGFAFLEKKLEGGKIGFVLSSLILFTANLQWALREAAEAENNMTAVARALEYTGLKPEAAWESEPGTD